MRKLIVVVAVMAIVGGTAWGVLAATGKGVTPVNCMDTHWRTPTVSTTSTSFTTVPLLTDDPSSIYPISVNVSALVSGAPVEFRILNTDVGSQTDVSRPGATRFVPNGGDPDSFSYQWVEPNQSAAIHVTSLELQWRSPTGQPVNMLRGDMAVEFSTEKGSCTGSA
ncbi:MAG: hypothetical protein M3P11_10955 [Actinomycetota bacterium]|nr:hypothetical protein [Actinomycetota bacterium]